MTSQISPVHDHETDGQQQSKTCKANQNNAGIFPVSFTIGSNQEAHFRQNSFDSNDSEEEGYDMVTGAKPTPKTTPEFLTGRPMQSRTKTPHQQRINADMLDTTFPAQQSPLPITIRICLLKQH